MAVLIDADHESLSLADTVCFEMEELMHAKGAVAPVITYLFHRLEARFDGQANAAYPRRSLAVP